MSGRFIRQDPSGFGAGDGNLYRYAGNGPTNAVDPNGLFGLGDLLDPQFYRDWAHYVVNPSQMDADLQNAQRVAITTAAVSVALIGAGSMTGLAALNLGLNASQAALAADSLILAGTAAALVNSTRVGAQGGDPLSGAVDAANCTVAFALSILIGSELIAQMRLTFAGLQFGRPDTGGPSSTLPSRPPVTLYHCGDLSAGVSGSRPLSTSPVPNLDHYHAGGQLYQFQVPAEVYDGWVDSGLVQQYNDFHMPSGITIPEMRNLPPASGQMGEYVLTP